MKEEKISNQLFRLINKIIFLEKKNIFEYTGIKLFPSEIHLLMLLSADDQQSTSATNIASKFGISKSAVSQTISRLIKKGVITKNKDTYNKNELIISFTSIGEKAFAQYKEKQTFNQRNINDYLNAITEHDRGVINDFLYELEDMLGRLR